MGTEMRDCRRSALLACVATVLCLPLQAAPITPQVLSATLCTQQIAEIRARARVDGGGEAVLSLPPSLVEESLELEDEGDAAFTVVVRAQRGQPRPPHLEGPVEAYLCTVRGLPAWLHGKDATALLDRFHGMIPGWEIPRIHKGHIASGVGLRADYLSEILHELRRRDEYMDFVNQHTNAPGDADKRDLTALLRLSAAFLRLYFPDLRVTREELEHFCLQPARTMRALIREQMSIMDPEYKPQLAPMECVL